MGIGKNLRVDKNSKHKPIIQIHGVGIDTETRLYTIF